jgi:hypothetical protein
MSNPNISASLTPANIAAIGTSKDAILVILNFLVNLTPAERKKLRKMATKREGYVTSVYQAAGNNPTAIPASFDMGEYKKDVDLMTAMKTVRDLISPLAEGINDTIMLLSNELMEQSDKAYGFLQTAAKGDAALTTIVSQISTAFAGQGKKKNATVVSIPMSGSSSQQKVNTRNRFTNSGTTVLQVVKTGMLRSQAITIAPQSSLKLDSKWTNITIWNNSAADDGECMFYLKP